ncbi:hypothetical protein D9758_005144 [Tetrapyrgos nigripes]|uniref:Uncharacterized protein n=1 Tax=Tetrapyrgos nigripes TaxID=182062 RepID=A0A8H5LWF4_9AGAR|nr:hypothetical protein D9758_005144 [Tetrapyrgos nigripes]
MSTNTLGKRCRKTIASPMDSTDDDDSEPPASSGSALVTSSPARTPRNLRRSIQQPETGTEPASTRKSRRKSASAASTTAKVTGTRPRLSLPIRPSSQCTPTDNNKLIPDTPIHLKFAPGVDKEIRDQMYLPTIPNRGATTAVDHQEQKLYLLTYHLVGEGPGSTIHCLDLKKMEWDDTVHDIRSANQYNSEKKSLPPCLRNTLEFVRQPDGQTFLFIIGGHFGHHLDDKDIGLNAGPYMTILVVNISQRTWSVLPTVGSAPKRFGHAVACLGNRFYIFGGTDRLPDYVETDISCEQSTHRILSSYSILEYDLETGRGIWTIENEPYPEDVPSMGYHMDAAVIGSTNTDLRILLIPGFREDHKRHFDKLADFVLYSPSSNSFMSWKDTSPPDPDFKNHQGVCPYIYPLPSTTFKQGWSDRVIFALSYQNSSIRFFSYRPPYSDSLLFLGEVKPSVTRRRKDGPVGKIGPSVKERSFAGFVTVGEGMYILGKDVDDDDYVETIIRVRVPE